MQLANLECDYSQVPCRIADIFWRENFPQEKIRILKFSPTEATSEIGENFILEKMPNSSCACSSKFQ